MPSPPPQIRFRRTGLVARHGVIRACRTGIDPSGTRSRVRGRASRTGIAWWWWIRIDMLGVGWYKGIDPRGNRQPSSCRFAIPEAGRMRCGRHGGSQMMRAPWTAAGKHTRGRVGRPDWGSRYAAANLRRRGGRRFDHAVQRQTCARGAVMRHDQRRWSPADFRRLAKGGCGGGDTGCRQVPGMTATVGPLAGTGASSSTALWTNPICADLALEPCSGGS